MLVTSESSRDTSSPPKLSRLSDAAVVRTPRPSTSAGKTRSRKGRGAPDKLGRESYSKHNSWELLVPCLQLAGVL
jgi:hypothetical protein